jgi:hypothetical protein
LSSDLKSLIVQNELNLPKESVERLLSLNGRKGLYALSPEKEPGPFLLWCCGDSLDAISAKMNLPMDVIVATAIQYKWAEKSRILHRDKAGIVPADLQKELVNTILVATVMSMQRQLGDVIAGRIDASECALIPSSPQALQKLMEMISALNGSAPAPVEQPRTVIHATNVQVNQGVATEGIVSSEEKTALRIAMLKEVEDSSV